MAEQDVDIKPEESEDDVPVVPEVEELLLEEYEDGLEIMDTDPAAAIRLFQAAVAKEDPTGRLIKLKELAILNIGKLYARSKDSKSLGGMLLELRPFFATIPKAKTAKIVRSITDLVASECDDLELLESVLTDSIAWCRKEKRTFLKQRLQLNLAALQLKQTKYKSSLELLKKLVREVKRFDDKLLMVEIQLLESRLHVMLQNLPKAKGALTAARSAANAVYCPPLLQAEVDLQAGTLCAEEKDYKTAFSYFYESFEGYNTANKAEEAVLCLKYMLLGKIMTNNPEDVYSIINSKAGIKYAGAEVEALRAVADAYKKRSIDAFQLALDKYQKELQQDLIISGHLDEVKNSLLEQNLMKLIEPFSRVQIPHVAKLIDLPVLEVEAKLSEMILDKKLAGILDQGSGDLIVFESVNTDKTYTASIDTIGALSNVVDRLYNKATRLHSH